MLYYLVQLVVPIIVPLLLAFILLDSWWKSILPKLSDPLQGKEACAKMSKEMLPNDASSLDANIGIPTHCKHLVFVDWLRVNWHSNINCSLDEFIRVTISKKP
jgi:hypothetical protein